MSFLTKLFGKGTPPPPPADAALQMPPEDPSKDPNMIRVHDAYGRELFITREQWRDSVLLGNIEKMWNKPDELYGMILSALNDGFRSDVVHAARHLYNIDPDRVRAACVWGIVLNEEGRLNEAETVFKEHIAKHGDAGVILTNLAKVYSKQGDARKAEAMLWHALELDPNQDNGMGWYEAIHRERGGDEASVAALRRVAEIPGSWRAQLWLGRAALQRRDLSGALAFYRQALSRVNPVPADALMQISGDLGNAGHLIEIVEIIGPRFDATFHGLHVGNNLIKAHLDLGQLDAARGILDQLYALPRPDWKQTLAFWDTEIAKACVATTPTVNQDKLQVAMLAIDGPVWLKPGSPAAELFPTKDAGTVRLACLGGSAEVPTNSRRAKHQLADTPGRLSRAIPLFLAEQIEFGTDAQVQTLVPWIADGSGAFVLAGAPWSDEQAAASGREGETKNDYVVYTHLRAESEPWIAQVRLIRTIDGACLETADTRLSAEQPNEGVQKLVGAVFDLLARKADLGSRLVPHTYAIPGGNAFPYYLLRLEQLLAIRCAAMSVGQGRQSFLNGERDILDGNLQQCLAYPQSVSVRVLMAQTFWTLKLVRPDIVAEFKERVEMLRREHPLDEPAQSVVGRILNEAFAG